MWALLAIPFALTYAFGRLVGDQRQGWALFAAMFVLWIASAGVAIGFEVAGNPLRRGAAARRTPATIEGKEVRFGPAASGLFAASTTGTSTGAVNRGARQLHAARRRGAAREHHARRGRARAASAPACTGC